MRLRRVRNLAVSTLLSASPIFVLPLLAVADTETEITNTLITQLNVHVTRGEKLEISNSQICVATDKKCVIFVDADARLEINNSQLGGNLEIYHLDSQVRSISLSNSPSAARFREGNPVELSLPVVDFTRIEDAGAEKEVNNQILNNYSVSIKANEVLSFNNSKVCVDPGMEECVITLAPSARLAATNTIFGSRVVIASEAPLITGLKLSNVKFHGSTRVMASDSKMAPARAERIEQENEKVVASLRAEKLDAEVSERGVIVNLPDVFFEFDQSELTPEAKFNVRKMATILKEIKGRSFSIEGHTDSMGSDNYNYKLSRARAMSVRGALASHGVEQSTMQAIGFGEDRPLDTNETDLGRAKNRRVEVVIENTLPTTSKPNDLTADLNRGTSGTSIVVNDDETAVLSKDQQIRIDDSGITVRSEGLDIDINADGVRVTK